MARFAQLSISIAAAIIIGGGLTKAAAAGRVKVADWNTIQSERYGFMLAYPASVFAPHEGPKPDEGYVLVSRDGAAQLLVATFENDGNLSMDTYRQHILDNNYTGAELDYAPIRRRHFIVSGTRGEMHFYERVSFICGGRFINSWALLYPVSERAFYDRVVEAVALTYTPGSGRKGECD